MPPIRRDGAQGRASLGVFLKPRITRKTDMAKKKKSACIELLDLVWANANNAIPHSWERLNHAMSSALRLAIGSGFELLETDILHVFKNYRSGYWIGESDEWIYCHAIACNNMSAIKSFESAKGRTPFIADNVSIGGRYRVRSEFMHGGCGTRKKERLAVGAEFPYRGLTLRVTSFAADSSYINCCSYKKRDSDGSQREKIDKRFKLTVEDIRLDRAERKERDVLLCQILKHIEQHNDRESVEQALGIKSMNDYAKLPIEKIREVVAQLTDEKGTK